ncbi:MAG: Peptidase M23 [Parcubacteria group bacterium GW2011_GWA2_47_7]|nr:MAG: Peptidase M23 [Parcubacteria group bacterium GW2011_GWA2_47_7]
MIKHSHLFYIALSLLYIPVLANAQVVRSIEFPVNGPNNFFSDFGAPRGGGTRKHLGNDIIAAKMTPVVSAVNGTVNYVISPEAAWGYEISIIDAEGYQYLYFHLNNDTPSTDDGKGGEANAYAPGLDRGQSVTKGQLLGWVGDSGNAENTVSHLHFEIHDPARQAIDPYSSLITSTGDYRSSNAKLGITPDIRLQLEKVVDGRPNDIFKTILEQGAGGEEVRQLQIVLKVLGLIEKENITGYFGPITREAVIAFQKRQMIDPVGTVGPVTREALNRGIASGVLLEYKPFYSEREQRAILIQKLLAQIKVLQDRLRAIQGIL